MHCRWRQTRSLSPLVSAVNVISYRFIFAKLLLENVHRRPARRPAEHLLGSGISTNGWTGWLWAGGRARRTGKEWTRSATEISNWNSDKNPPVLYTLPKTLLKPPPSFDQNRVQYFIRVLEIVRLNTGYLWIYKNRGHMLVYFVNKGVSYVLLSNVVSSLFV